MSWKNSSIFLISWYLDMVWSWWVTSSTWSNEFIFKLFLVCNLHINHGTNVMVSSIVPFYQGLLLVLYLTSYHIWKLRFETGRCTTPSINHVCKRNSTHEGLKAFILDFHFILFLKHFKMAFNSLDSSFSYFSKITNVPGWKPAPNKSFIS